MQPGSRQVWGSVVDTNHYAGGLYHRVSFLADGEAQLLDRVHGDSRGDDVTAADVNLDYTVDGALLDVGDGALELIACAEFHFYLPFLVIYRLI